jgi:hypothetical protein
MTATRIDSTRRSLKTPRAAAIAGIVFALLYGASIVLIRAATPSDHLVNSTWLTTNAGTFSLALNLLPYAGIAFLWFIGVIRDRLGDLEDRFFATVFLGSGLLFLAMTFVGAALAGGIMASAQVAPGASVDNGLYTYSRAVIYEVINTYAIRMAGVFMVSLATIWLRTGLMQRGWALLTYALALVLLLAVGFSLWVPLIFPAWVMAVSVYFLIRSLRDQPQEATVESGTV